MFESVSKLFSFSKWFSSNQNLSIWLTDVQSRLKFWKKRSITLNRGDLTYHVTYLGNVPTFWAKGDQFIESPLNILWKNYERRKGKKALTKMKITICNSGLKVYTRELGDIEYWSNKITYVTNTNTHPRVFIWIYRHTGKRGKPELRCHAVLCKRSNQANQMADELRIRLYNALREFRREIYIRQQTPNNTLPIRKKFLVNGSKYFKQPLERSQSAPKLDSILEESSDADTDDHHSDIISINGECMMKNNINNQSIEYRPFYFISTGQLNKFDL
ncbi:Phosphotyrosine interaction domain containing protein [Euroglyphus maynei]|uniref:Phosphotyrosine interaction domain containing protein n=1 Tax=Euroglyphus maynei TaxID=6958 RepID=A0A1Y3AWP2_EURMA|nr:Phosphotyrosine interaction domain containing protein [Euroglyphus maynei]